MPTPKIRINHKKIFFLYHLFISFLFKDFFINGFPIGLVAFPIVLALSWAGYNIGRAAIGQLQLAIRQFKQNTEQ